MLKNISIKDLYPLALAEGEGVGTAYEYFAKRLLLRKWLANGSQPQRIVIAGLPQKYGTSMDFLLLASELNADLTICDDRALAVDRCTKALQAVQKNGLFKQLNPHFFVTQDLTRLPEINEHFDLALSSEVLQRVSLENRQDYFTKTLKLASKVALFTPNGDNPAHTHISGLSGLTLSELEQAAGQGLESVSVNKNNESLLAGYIDMPPFPPGMTRTENQREQATTGTAEAFAMWGLAQYARLERWFPTAWRKNKSHIVYSFLNTSQR